MTPRTGVTASLPAVSPMLASDGPLPAQEAAYGYEFKWDGIRVIAHIDHDRIRLHSRRLNDVTAQYPELGALARAARAHAPLVLDGEIVCLNAAGLPDFGLLQQRMNLADASAIDLRRRDLPVTLILFDVLAVKGRSLVERPYRDRRRILESMTLEGPHWHTPAYFPARGRASLEAARDLGLEGIVAKRLDSPYEPGRRTGAWVKTKIIHHDEFVVGGWTEGQGGRRAAIGALLLGYHRTPEDPRLAFAGRVGTGFTDDELGRLARLLAPLATDTSPFLDRRGLPRKAHFVQPTLVAEVGYTEWTHHGTLRHPRYLGLRDDKRATDVVIPQPLESQA